MSAVAAVMTGKGAGAIATVCVIGEGATAIVRSIFRPGSKDKLTTNEHELTRIKFEVGKILLGHIVDGEKVIDQVVIGCEGENELAINCHGNPLIVEMIMELLVNNGVEAVSAEQFLKLKSKKQKAKIQSKNQIDNDIAIEASLVQLKAKTIEGYKLLQNQIEGGLSAKAEKWLKTNPLGQIQNEAMEILKASHAAQYIIHGCKVVLAGPANSGKSTLLNYLARRDKSIVADIPGTTRDWVSAQCVSGPLAMEIIDTAGLDELLTLENAIDKEAQERSVELIRQADIVVWVIDGTEEISNSKFQISDIPAIIAINKCDLGLKTDRLPEQAFVISAKNGTGIDEMTKKIRTILGVEGFDLKQAVCFTQIQKQVLQKIVVAKDTQEAKNALAALL